MKSNQQVLADYIDAYIHANGKAPDVTFNNGWFKVSGVISVKRARLMAMTMALLSRPAYQKEVS